MPTTSQFDPLRHDQYMKAREQMGMAMQSFRALKRAGGSLIDQRATIQGDMLTKALDNAMKRAVELQSGKAGEFAVLKGTISKVQHITLTIEIVSKYSINGMYEPQKEETVQKCLGHLKDGLNLLNDAVTTLKDVTLSQ